MKDLYLKRNELNRLSREIQTQKWQEDLTREEISKLTYIKIFIIDINFMII